MTEPLPPQTPVYDEPAPGRFQDKRALAIIAGAVLAVVAVGAFVVVPKLGGSSSSTSAAVVPHGHPKVSATPTPTVTAAPAGVATAAPALHVRDPFSPLVAPPVAAAASPTAAASPSPSATPTAPTVVVVEPTATPSAKYTVTLTALAIDPNNDKNDTATVTVNGTSQTVKGDQPFPTTNGPFALVGVATDGTNHQYDSGQFMYGDQLFSLSLNETQTFS